MWEKSKFSGGWVGYENGSKNSRENKFLQWVTFQKWSSDLSSATSKVFIDVRLGDQLTVRGRWAAGELKEQEWRLSPGLEEN